MVLMKQMLGLIMQLVVLVVAEEELVDIQTHMQELLELQILEVVVVLVNTGLELIMTAVMVPLG